jgi:endo-1,4-beta-mannosidase
MSEPFVLGVNYWPRRKAMYWWSSFDQAEVREEFELIAKLGLNVVRLFLLWDDFQPGPEEVSPERLADLERVCDIAAGLNLGLDVTFFTGHMSGPNWAPRWLLGGPPAPAGREVVSMGQVTQKGYRNPFHDPVALKASRLLLETVVGRLKDHPGIWMWNLGNEPDLFAWPHDAAAGRAWVREMSGLIRSLDPVHPITCGLHVDSLFRDNGFRVDQVYAETEVAVMHAYPMYLTPHVEPLDPNLVPFSCAVTAALSGKAVLMEEFGGPTAPPGEPTHTWEWKSRGQARSQLMISEDDLAEFLRQTLPRLVQVGATGALIWCFADYAPELWDKPPCLDSHHERHFGLVRPDGSLKPHARALQEFAAGRPTVKEAPEWTRFDLDPDIYYAKPADTLLALYQDYLKIQERL